MKNFLIFIIGAGVGFGSAMLVLHKSIKKQLELMQQNMKTEQKPAENAASEGEKEPQEEKKEEPDMPFRMNNERREKAKQEKTAYYKIVEQYESKPPVPVMDRDESNGYGVGAEFVDTNGLPEFEAIDKETFNEDKSYNKENFVYYMSDRIMCTENGTKIENPAIFVGNTWEQYIGLYKMNTAFIRNNRNLMDYEICVEEGLYSDDYGSDG